MESGHSIVSLSPQKMGHLDIAVQVFVRWEQLRRSRCFASDTDVAHFLLRNYECSRSEQCTICQCQLVLTCPQCQPAPLCSKQPSPVCSKQGVKKLCPLPLQQDSPLQCKTETETCSVYDCHDQSHPKSDPTQTPPPSCEVAAPCKVQVQHEADNCWQDTEPPQPASCNDDEDTDDYDNGNDIDSSNAVRSLSSTENKPQRRSQRRKGRATVRKSLDCGVTCAKRFTSHSRLQSHMKSHSIKQKSLFVCPKCPKVFTYQASFRAHLKRAKPGYQCDYDQEALSTNKALQLTYSDETIGCMSDSECQVRVLSHASMASRFNKTRRRCSDDMITKVKIPIPKHERKDKDEKEIETQQQTFNSSAYQTQPQGRRKCRGNSDLKAVGSKTPKEIHHPVNCDLCGTTVSRARDLKIHMRIHTGEKPFVCCECKQSFRHRASYKLHVKHNCRGDFDAGKQSSVSTVQKRHPAAGSDLNKAEQTTKHPNDISSLSETSDQNGRQVPSVTPTAEEQGDSDNVIEQDCFNLDVEEPVSAQFSREQHIFENSPSLCPEQQHYSALCQQSAAEQHELKTFQQKLHLVEGSYHQSKAGNHAQTKQNDRLQPTHELSSGSKSKDWNYPQTKQEDRLQPTHELSSGPNSKDWNHPQTKQEDRLQPTHALSTRPTTAVQTEDPNDSVQLFSYRPRGRRPFNPSNCVSCHICGVKISRQRDLKIHMRIHSGEKPYLCSECGEDFRQAAGLVAHNLRKHSGQRPYVCDQCGASFPLVGSLNQHMRIHNDIKRYTCDQCGKSFLRSSDLKGHIARHLGIKKFSCEECQKTFSTSSELAKHKTLHTGEKPYICTECRRAFRLQKSLKRHMQTHLKTRRLHSMDNTALTNAQPYSQS